MIGLEEMDVLRESCHDSKGVTIAMTNDRSILLRKTHTFNGCRSHIEINSFNTLKVEVN